MLLILVKEINVIALEFSFEKYIIEIFRIRYWLNNNMLGKPTYSDPCYVGTYVYSRIITTVGDSLRLLLCYRIVFIFHSLKVYVLISYKYLLNQSVVFTKFSKICFVIYLFVKKNLNIQQNFQFKVLKFSIVSLQRNWLTILKFLILSMEIVT